MKEHLNRREIIEAITPVIENTAMRYNLIPIEVELEKESGNWFLRIYILLFIHNSYSDILYDFIKLLFMDIVNDTREKAAFMARGMPPCRIQSFLYLCLH